MQFHLQLLDPIYKFVSFYQNKGNFILTLYLEGRYIFVLYLKGNFAADVTNLHHIWLQEMLV